MGRNSTSGKGYIAVIVVTWVVGALIGSFGAFLPSTTLGELQWYDNHVLRALVHPAAWLSIGVGASALIAFFVVAERTGTMRGAIAASTTIVFLGLLLYPIWFSSAVDEELADRMVWAWAVIIVFYFGTEAAVQGTQVVQRRKAVSAGATEPAAEGISSVPGDAASSDPEFD